MGQIQSAVNSAISGTAFLLNQSGALNGVKAKTTLKTNAKNREAYVAAMRQHGVEPSKEENEAFAGMQRDLAYESGSKKLVEAAGGAEGIARAAEKSDDPDMKSRADDAYEAGYYYDRNNAFDDSEGPEYQMAIESLRKATARKQRTRRAIERSTI